MSILRSSEQFANDECSIRDSFEPGSNARVESLRQPEKTLSPNSSTEEGMHIDTSDEQFEKAESPICDSRESDSNATVESLPHSEKQS
jgi:hypothetical protein